MLNICKPDTSTLYIFKAEHFIYKFYLPLDAQFIRFELMYKIDNHVTACCIYCQIFYVCIDVQLHIEILFWSHV